MAETAPHSPENLPELPAAERGEHLLPTAEQAEPLRQGEQDPAKALEAARARVHETSHIEQQQNPVEQLQAAEEASRPAPATHITPELKQATLNRELTAIRRRLNRRQRTLSKVIHQPAVRAVSEPLGKTASRPSGLLGGGIAAFLGSLGYLYLTAHNHMRYSYSVFLGLLLAGFLAGVIVELLFYAVRRPRRHHS